MTQLNSLESLFSLYGTGRTTGLVVDSGYSVSSVVPIIDGYSHSYAHSVSYDGSLDVNYRLQSILAQRYPALKIAEEVIEDIKITRCRVRNIAERLNPDQSYEMSYDLPDGNKIQLGYTETTLPYEKCFSNYVRGPEANLFNSFFTKSQIVSSP